MDTEKGQAYRFFFQTANQDQIDLIGFMLEAGVYRRVTREKTTTIFKCCCEWGLNSDWQFSETLIEDQTWEFDIQQIDTMMNNAVRGHQTLFSIKQLLEQAKLSSVDILSNEADIQNNINADFDNNSATYPPELDAALQAWRAISTKPQPKGRIGITSQIERWLDTNKPDLSDEARRRIKMVANWEKQKSRQTKKTGKPPKGK